MNSFACQAGRCVRRVAVCVSLCAAILGCRNNPHVTGHIEILNAEKRALEDQIYSLEYDYERKCAELKDALAEIERLGGGESRRGTDSRRAQPFLTPCPGALDARQILDSARP